jgi:hypothetical protein
MTRKVHLHQDSGELRHRAKVLLAFTSKSAQSLPAVNSLQAVTRRLQIADLGYALDSDCTDHHASSGTRCVRASVPLEPNHGQLSGPQRSPSPRVE